MASTINELFDELQEMTVALRNELVQSGDGVEITERVQALINGRKTVLAQLGKQLGQLADTEPYRAKFEQWKEVETAIEKMISDAMEELSQKIKGSKQKRTLTRQYHSYLRVMPYGSFIDKKK
ncbi:hypothetical protein [Brevibacillus fulvus]|uniref:Flagellar protein FliT n=1 Tax=Brevibacillus fulvus TaxID=1125967 RepID=A0A938Y1K5_9BACL|nr:hypothetical protein [Brevibacillus fulvus]MBM7591493.1 O6-methylguanine-DNA--protein-cysteine methyltransferase [Brevibacillus fulvus]